MKRAAYIYYRRLHRFTIRSLGFYLVFSPVTFSFTTSPERPEGMRPSRPFLLLICPRLALPMSLMLLAGLAGCGSASSDNAPTLGPRASVGELPSSQKNPPPRTEPLRLGRELRDGESRFRLLRKMGPAQCLRRRQTRGDSTEAAPAPSAKPANPMDDLVVPAWIAKDLASPDVDTRLRALETWVLIAPAGSIDPYILAFGNDDERVRGRAVELLKQQWTCC